MLDDWCPYNKRKRHPGCGTWDVEQRKVHLKTQCQDGPPQVKASGETINLLNKVHASIK